MQLTREEQQILDGEEGIGKQKAMEILVALGKIYGATRLFPVKSVQVPHQGHHCPGWFTVFDEDAIETFANGTMSVQFHYILCPAYSCAFIGCCSLSNGPGVVYYGDSIVIIDGWIWPIAVAYCYDFGIGFDIFQHIVDGLLKEHFVSCWNYD